MCAQCTLYSAPRTAVSVLVSVSMNAPMLPVLVLRPSTPALERCFLFYPTLLLYHSVEAERFPFFVALYPFPYRFSSAVSVSVLGLVFGPPIRCSLLVAPESNARTYSTSTNIRLMYAPSVRPPLRPARCLARSTRISTAMFYTLFSLSFHTLTLNSGSAWPSQRRSDKCVYRRCGAARSPVTALMSVSVSMSS